MSRAGVLRCASVCGHPRKSLVDSRGRLQYAPVGGPEGSRRTRTRGSTRTDRSPFKTIPARSCPSTELGSDDPERPPTPLSRHSVATPRAGGRGDLLTASSTFTGGQEPCTSTLIWIERCHICCMTYGVESHPDSAACAPWSRVRSPRRIRRRALACRGAYVDGDSVDCHDISATNGRA